MSEVCVYCQNRYVNYVNYCVMCGRIQPPLSPITEPESSQSKKSRRRHRLTREQRDMLMADIRRGLDSGDLNIHVLAQKYGVDRKTIAYWKKKVDSQS